MRPSVVSSSKRKPTLPVAAAPPPLPSPAACSGGIDNDGDGRIDYPADKGCKSSGDDHEESGNSWKRKRSKRR